MGRRAVSPRIISVALFCCTVLGAQTAQKSFEQSGTVPGAWRAGAANAEMLVLPNGFILRKGTVTRRLRWDASMALNTLEPEQSLPVIGYELDGPTGQGMPLARAERIRAVGRRGISVLYYFGPRGLEFNIELEPSAQPRRIQLTSADGDLSVDNRGRISIDGEELALKPVGWTVDAKGQRRLVHTAAELGGARQVTFKAAKFDHTQRLVIDPVMTYASYFGGSNSESALLFRELADKSILIVGNTRSVDLPQGVDLNGILMQPNGPWNNQQCFVARLAPASKQIIFVSYFGGSGFNNCTGADVDRQGRILLTGVTEGSPTLATSNAQHPAASYVVDGFLARISADGKTLDYATYLDLNLTSGSIFIQAGPADTAYLGLACTGCYAPGVSQQTPSTLVLLRYNIASRTFDQTTSFGSGILNGMAVSPAGGVYLFGSTSSSLMPANQIQTAPPVSGASAGFVTGVTPDFGAVLFSSYLGGQKGNTNIQSIFFNADGSLWLSGMADQGSIPNLQPARPFQSPYFTSPFAVQVLPGTPSFSRGFLAGGYGLGSLTAANGIVLADGRYCLATYGPDSISSMGGAATGGTGNVPLMGCLNDAGNDFQTITPTGTNYQATEQTLLAPSQAGGVWSLQVYEVGFPDVVPFDFKAGAIQPYPHPAASGYNAQNLVLRYFDLSTPPPALINPQPMQLSALQSNFTSSVNLAGSNFSQGMQISIDGNLYPLTVTGPTTATLNYRSAAVNLAGNVLNLAAGNYTGYLVIPTQPQPLTSAPFSVIVNNLVPAFQPFTPTSNPLTFTVSPPVYNDSQALWNGTPLPITPGPTSGTMQVQIPPDLGAPGTGQFTLINQPPGGGVQTETVSIQTTASGIVGGSDPAPIRIPASFFQVDKTREVLYTLADAGAQWTLSAWALPGGSQIQSISIPKNGAGSAVDFALSGDGSLLWMIDDQLRITRFQTTTLSQDLTFQVATDAPRPQNSSAETRQRLRTLADSPGSILLVTPAGRMVVYDGNEPRPYTTTEFPDPNITVMDPVLATSSYVYALQQPNVYHEVPCLARYPVDGLGFGPPEDFCNPGADWGKYPEMKVYAGTLVLENSAGAFGIQQEPDVFDDMRLAGSYDTLHNLIATANIATFNFNTRAATYQINLARLDTAQPLGHYPRTTVLNAYPSQFTFLDDGTMVYFESPSLTSGGDVAVVPQWASASQQSAGTSAFISNAGERNPPHGAAGNSQLLHRPR
jgi:hypothetical protein